MNLTAETFLQIVKSLRSDVAGEQSREQRKMPRVGIRGRAAITVPSKSGPKLHPVSVRDIAANGIGLLINEPLVSVGQEFILILPSAGEQEKRHMLCQVKRFHKISSNLYSLGAVFQREIMTKPAAAASAKPLQQPSPELLAEADAAAVNEIEERLKRLSA